MVTRVMTAEAQALEVTKVQEMAIGCVHRALHAC